MNNSQSLTTRLLLVLLLTTQQVLASLSVFHDIYAYPKYEVNFLDDQYYTVEEAKILLSLNALSSASTAESANSTFSYQLVKTPKEDYLCEIEHIRPDSNDSEDRISKEKQEIIDKIPILSQSIKSELEGKCILLVDGYWTYSLCNNSQVSQFHGGVNSLSNPKLFRYILGNVPSSADAEKEKDLTAKSNYTVGRDHISWYLSKTFDNGTICDLTGLPRTVEVQYSCNPTEGNANLFSSKEYSTCNYIVKISVPELCQEKVFRSRRDPFVSEIKCQKVLQGLGSGEELDHAPQQESMHLPSKISLLNYDLHSLGQELFSGFPKADDDDIIILIDLDSNAENLIERFGSVYFKSLEQNKLVSPAQATILQNEAIGYYFNAHVYDHKGDYEATLEIAFEKQDPPIITITSPKDLLRITSNVKSVITLKDVIGKAMKEGRK
ncbi:hypothetical protein WICPIJ_003565 [Wickerhamomyces pijperi]|uniref:Endoplasmic reticulum lectin n=1 Tax=Wickerhamomyces pijperi TaxID=599730 RepID=A0A9P8Q9K7_WICPI|nr:hypothetical protein WICPIJ_003565 [Wickerhamomyces pijperi]